MANQTGISIIIKAFLPTGKTIDEQFSALSMVKDAHEKGDYASLLAASTIEEVKTEQKTRRIEEAKPEDRGSKTKTAKPSEGQSDKTEAGEDKDVPAFLKDKKKTSS